MKKAFIVGALALVSTLSFASEKLGTQNFAPEALEKIKSIKTISPMSLDKATELDAGFLTGLVYASQNGGAFSALSDLFWASSCSNHYSNMLEWKEKYLNTKAHNNKSIILMRLRAQADTNSDAKLAYRSIIIAERISNCGSEDDVYGNFIELLSGENK